MLASDGLYLEILDLSTNESTLEVDSFSTGSMWVSAGLSSKILDSSTHTSTLEVDSFWTGVVVTFFFLRVRECFCHFFFILGSIDFWFWTGVVVTFFFLTAGACFVCFFSLPARTCVASFTARSVVPLFLFLASRGSAEHLTMHLLLPSLVDVFLFFKKHA